MNKIRLTLNILAVFAVCLLCSSLAQAQATRTWVSGVGDDVNPCSRTAPCKTFAGAISKTAAGGEINVLDAGGFGAVTITKSITIDGGESFSSILSSGTNGVIVNAGANDVITLRNLYINGAGTGLNGIRFLAGKSLHVQNVVIFGVTTHGIDINQANAGNVTVQDSTIRECGSSGINAVSTSGNVAISVTNSQIDKCATGVKASTNSRVTIRNAVITLCTTGVLTELAAEANIDSSLLSHHSTGIQVGSGTTARITNDTIANNLTGVANSGIVQTASNNRFLGNTTDNTGNAFVPVAAK